MKTMGTKLSVSWLISLLLSLAHFGSVLTEGALAPALYVFGDSLVDSGNNNILPTIAKADFLPYGINFVKGATGRFTNGKTVVDFIGMYFLGLPYAPPCLSIHGSAIRTGLNYASGSCGILPETGSRYGKCLNLKEQIDLFERTVKSDLSGLIKNPSDLAVHLSKSINIFSVGSNDFLLNYLQPNDYDTSKRYPPPQFAQLLVDQLSRHLERLYNLGARKIVVFEIGPLGCIPSIAKKQRHEGNCVEGPNHLASNFNDKLRATLANLTFNLKGSLFVLGRANGVGYDAITSPLKYGLEDGLDPCCKTLNYTGCIPWATPCLRPNSRFFWDAFHLTEQATSVIATRCFNDSTFCTPLSIKQLVQM